MDDDAHDDDMPMMLHDAHGRGPMMMTMITVMMTTMTPMIIT